jgi:glycine dehydrogenase subunit 1
VSLVTQSFFNEFTLKLPNAAAQIVDHLAERNILSGVPGSRLLPHEPVARDLLIVAATETTTDEDAKAFADALGECLS